MFRLFNLYGNAFRENARATDRQVIRERAREKERERARKSKKGTEKDMRKIVKNNGIRIKYVNKRSLNSLFVYYWEWQTGQVHSVLWAAIDRSIENFFKISIVC